MLLLERLLEGLEVDVAPFAICEVSQGASLQFPQEETAAIHYVLEGRGLASMSPGGTVALAPHTVIVTPPTGAFRVTCSGDPRHVPAVAAPGCEPLPGGWQRISAGNGTAGVVMACGALKARDGRAVDLFDYLSEPLIASMSGENAFRGAFHMLLDELQAPRLGTSALAASLMKQCLIVLLRRYCDGDASDVPWLAALDDPRLGLALQAMLERPEAPHCLASLADLSGMSRAAFSQRFTDAFGRSAMGFLKEIRLRRAANYLSTTDLPVKTVAGRVGFASRSHFSRSFKALHGVDPVAYRTDSQRKPGGPARSVHRSPARQLSNS